MLPVSAVLAETLTRVRVWCVWGVCWTAICGGEAYTTGGGCAMGQGRHNPGLGVVRSFDRRMGRRNCQTHI